jgi:hypothetical protein
MPLPTGPTSFAPFVGRHNTPLVSSTDEWLSPFCWGRLSLTTTQFHDPNYLALANLADLPPALPSAIARGCRRLLSDCRPVR